MTESPSFFAPPFADRLIVCLCAQWCRTCDGYRMVFDEVVARFPGARGVWVDIEDQSDLMGDIDIETFPTVMVADGAQVRFFGTLTPHAQTLARLIESFPVDAPGEAAGASDDLRALLHHLRCA